MPEEKRTPVPKLPAVHAHVNDGLPARVGPGRWRTAPGGCREGSEEAAVCSEASPAVWAKYGQSGRERSRHLSVERLKNKKKVTLGNTVIPDA